MLRRARRLLRLMAGRPSPARPIPDELLLPEAKEILDGEYDVTWIARLDNMCRYRLPGGPRCILDIDDVRHREYARSTFSAGYSRRRRLRRWMEYRAWRKVELDALRRVGRAIVCSRLDQAHLGRPNVKVVHSSVAIRQDAAFHRGVPGRMVFVGTMAYRPNVDGVRYFVGKVLPLIRRACPAGHLHVVGLNPSSEVRRLDDGETVRVLGEVPEIGPHLAEAAISVVPLRMGAGTRLKILESLAHKTPVVSTSVGAEGLELENGRHLVIADEPDAFAKACVELLEDEDRRMQLASAGHARVRELYSREHVARQVAGVIDGLLRADCPAPLRGNA